MSEIREEKSDRGFVHLDEVATDYGAIIRIYESSACMVEGEDRGPWLWMEVRQPPPEYPGALQQELGRVAVHASVEQAEAIRDRLDHMIRMVKESWGIVPEPCPAKLWHGPGHQSSTPCELLSGHDGPHRCIYDSQRQEAVWKTGSYTDKLREQGIEFDPESYPEDMGMTGFFDEPPEDDEG